MRHPAAISVKRRESVIVRKMGGVMDGPFPVVVVVGSVGGLEDCASVVIGLRRRRGARWTAGGSGRHLSRIRSVM